MPASATPFFFAVLQSAFSDPPHPYCSRSYYSASSLSVKVISLDFTRKFASRARIVIRPNQLQTTYLHTVTKSSFSAPVSLTTLKRYTRRRIAYLHCTSAKKHSDFKYINSNSPYSVFQVSLCRRYICRPKACEPGQQ